ncbi:ABC transporter permease [Mesorhizobium sp. M1A.F.Ca.IN.020.06.1.1]|uniref:HoxN/HupN/NixA family nickel/cobalt transporter n=1 Tax=unclassified Mesorhizobium TaxID=325217 RepID=UPI000FCA52B5|nr:MULTISPECIES: ABC transporter permease [unclassified Mesorhizobium]RUV06750.1 ABC transporter permease [Mesorhizobium sp. M1A.F.Ca.IN.020.03.2.1]RUV88947.1 ABC transporter permease [Mesorhizobium sp. M1A.F.Ca.IN.020.32.1.1]RUW15476.1 ABC transporter permease [Mesorhizobium sp. M1A.F.Ca.IN.022.05.2.1]RUW36039.1 ABC transporter permease [Mesorhizobium sp. M1A.F.Ca.IN.020.06.1.1]RWF84288.1 MAG: ABC transporter permease [Mesorhizobium sp.]
MFQYLVEFQRTIYLALADQIKLLSSSGDWLGFVAFLPMGVVFGAAHALTPGHSKALLATYLAGSDAKVARGLLVSITLSLTHVIIAVIIAALSLPLVSVALGSVGRAPLLEDVSRGLLGLIGVWMIWRALSQGHHLKHEGEAVGFMAGLIPCPLTLFVMTFAMSRGVPVAGLLFAVTMMTGVAVTLSTVAVLSILFRERLVHIFESRPRLFAAVSRGIEGAAGIVLASVALWQIAAA